MDAGRWPRSVFWLFAAIHLVLWTILPLVTQPNAPLDAVEIVAWGHEWQLGYAKHPPLASWLAEAARVVGGHSGDWAIYLLGQLCVVTAFWAVWRLGLAVTSPGVALAGVLVLEATSSYTGATLEFNHNLVVLPFFPLSALCLYRAITSGRRRWWVATGAALGAGMMAKYTILLLGIAMAVFLVSNGEVRRRAAGPGPVLALGAALLVVLPHLVWLIASAFPTLAYAAERAHSQAGGAGHILYPLEFLGRQFLMLGFIGIAVLLLLDWPWRLRPLAPDERFRRRFLLAVGLGPCLCLLLVSAVTGMRLRNAWGMPLWSMLGLVLVFCFVTRPAVQLIRRAALVCALFAVVNVLVELGEDVAGPYVTGEGLRTNFPGRLLATRIVEAWQQRYDKPLPLVGGERWFAGNVAFYAPSRPSIFSNGGLGGSAPDEAACPWTSTADFKERGGVLVWSADKQGEALPEELRVSFPDAEVLPVLTLPRQTGAPVKPVRAGIAIVAPRSAPAPRSGASR